MKNLAIISTIIFSTIFSSTSYAEWVEIGETVGGDTYYLDTDRIRKVDGYVYYWSLTDYLKPNPYGSLSAKVYEEGDCKLFRYKTLSGFFYKQPMGAGVGVTETPKNPEWDYPPPNSVSEDFIKAACKLAK